MRQLQYHVTEQEGVMKKLIENGADISVVGSNGRTALMLTAAAASEGKRKSSF